MFIENLKINDEDGKCSTHFFQDFCCTTIYARRIAFLSFSSFFRFGRRKRKTTIWGRKKKKYFTTKITFLRDKNRPVTTCVHEEALLVVNDFFSLGQRNNINTSNNLWSAVKTFSVFICISVCGGVRCGSLAVCFEQFFFSITARQFLLFNLFPLEKRICAFTSTRLCWRGGKKSYV